MTPLQNQNVPPQDPRSFCELTYGEIRATARYVTVAISRCFPLNIVLGSWCHLRDRAITLLPEKMAIRLDARRMLIRIIQEMPPDERVDFARSILELIPQINQDIKNAFIETVATNLGNDEGTLARSLLRFITIEMYSSKNIAITRMLANLPLKNQREGVVKNSQLLITPKMTVHEVATIIQALAAIPAKDREPAIRSSQLLITPEMSENTIAGILLAVADIPVNEREEAVKISQLLISPEMSENTIAGILLAVAVTPVNKREEMITISQLLITLEMSKYSIVEIIRTVADIPVNEREEVIRCSQLLITPEMSASTIAAIIWAVANIPANEREAVIRCSQLLITPEMLECAIAAIIQAIAAIPVNEREDVIRRSQPLITPEITGIDKPKIVRAVANIPVNEREEVIRCSQLLITPEMSAVTVTLIIRAVANIPATKRKEAIRNAALPSRRGMNVHTNNRDQKTKSAIKLLFEHQKHITPSEINEAKDSFIAYLEEASIDETKKTLAKRALLEPRKKALDFGPLITDKEFTLLGLPISGADLIGRLWIFISHLDEEAQTHVTTSMISALIDSYSEPDVRVCNQGKTQRLIVAVLQGRLAGVNIEGDVVSVSTSEAIEMFFNKEAHKKIDTLKDLMEAANRFCNEHVFVNRDAFILEIEEYAEVQGMENTIYSRDLIIEADIPVYYRRCSPRLQGSHTKSRDLLHKKNIPT